MANARQRYSSTEGNSPVETSRIPLLPFVEAEHESSLACELPFTLQDYIDLVDWTGRLWRSDKKHALPAHQPRLLEQLRLSPQQWRLLSIDIQKQSLAALGSLDQLERYHASIHKRWMPRQHYLQRCYERLSATA